MSTHRELVLQCKDRWRKNSTGGVHLDGECPILSRQTTDGGPGSGHHNHKGVPGEIGGSAPSGKGMNGRISAAYKSGDYTAVGQEIRKCLKDIPIGAKFSHGGAKWQKTGDNEFTAEDKFYGNGKPYTANANVIANSTNAFKPETAPVFEDIDVEEVAEAKVAAGEIKPSETSVKTVSERVSSKTDLAKLSDEDRLQLIKELKPEFAEYWSGNGTAENFIASKYGLNKPPELLDDEEFDRYVKETGSTMMWRGVRDLYDEETDEKLVSAADIEREFATEDKDFTYGGGNYGNGYHFATEKRTAESFGASLGDQDGRVFTCALKPEAKVVPHDRAKREADRLGISQSLWALLNGFDAISSKSGVYNILNRGVLVMKTPPSVSKKKK